MISHRGVMMIGIPRRVAFWICGGVLAVSALGADSGGRWIGTWAASAQHWTPGRLQSFRNQTLRLIVHASIGGSKARVKIANTYGEQPLRIAAVHIARRTSGADIDSASDRSVTFHGQNAVTIPPRSIAVSDAV